MYQRFRMSTQPWIWFSRLPRAMAGIFCYLIFSLLFFFFSFKGILRKFMLSWKLLLCKKNILTICWRPFYETSRRLIACIISGIPGLSLMSFSHSLPLIQTNQELCRPSTPVTDNGFVPIWRACARKRMDFPALLMHSAERKPAMCLWD